MDCFGTRNSKVAYPDQTTDKIKEKNQIVRSAVRKALHISHLICTNEVEACWFLICGDTAGLEGVALRKQSFPLKNRLQR